MNVTLKKIMVQKSIIFKQKPLREVFEFTYPEIANYFF